MDEATHIYSSEFFAGRRAGSYSSATRIAPLVLELLPACRSVIDVGCGIGTWLRAFADNGVKDVFGVDGAYVDRTQLEIDADQFQAFDLREPLKIDRHFDLAISLEVAEHLPPRCADSFVQSLTSLAPVVLFSAAVPQQGGENHVNEQWLEYWVERFRQCGFVPIDCIRPRVWNDEAVDYWYAQNTLLYCRQDQLLDTCPALLKRAAADVNGVDVRSLVHPKTFLTELERLRERLTNATDPQRLSVRSILPTFAAALKNALRRRTRSLVKR